LLNIDRFIYLSALWLIETKVLLTIKQREIDTLRLIW